METAVVCLSIALTIAVVALAASLPFLWWKVFKHDRDLAELDDTVDEIGKLITDTIGSPEQVQKKHAELVQRMGKDGAA